MSDSRVDRVADWMAAPGVARVLGALAADGAQPRFVGGCVRNALLGAPVADLDVAIDRNPSEVAALLESGGVKAAPTGVEHGTITAVPPDDGAEPIEVTSLRRDVETDGRRAVVAFTHDWAEDAQRRDFTMNALYADPDGRLFDPLGSGQEDLSARRVRFIGRADDRIREDRLRVLRFFRFLAWYGATDKLSDADLDACRRHADDLGRLARERVWSETKKLFDAADPTAATALMIETGVFAASIAPPRDGAAARLRDLVQVERQADVAPSWRRRLAVVLDRPDGAFARAMKMSRTEEKALADLARAQSAPALESAYRYGADAAWDAAMIAGADPTRPSIDMALRPKLAAAAARTPPISAKDFIAAGIAPGPAIGAALGAAERHWIEHNFELDAAALLAHGLQKVNNTDN